MHNIVLIAKSGKLSCHLAAATTYKNNTPLHCTANHFTVVNWTGSGLAPEWQTGRLAPEWPEWTGTRVAWVDWHQSGRLVDWHQSGLSGLAPEWPEWTGTRVADWQTGSRVACACDRRDECTGGSTSQIMYTQLYCTIFALSLHLITQCCTTLNYIALCHTALHCTALYCNVLK